jgi:hypothetical protein
MAASTVAPESVAVPASGTGTHTCVVGSQTGIAELVQSALVLQLIEGSHVRFTLHMPERHTAAPPSPSEQGPSPLA